MEQLIGILMSTLRDGSTSRQDFRSAAHNLASVLAAKAAQHVPVTEATIRTPVSTTRGIAYTSPVVLLPILRSGLALLPAFLSFFPRADVGIVGVRRDEKTAQPMMYYNKVPHVEKNTTIILLDPMIATGGTACATIALLKEQQLATNNMIFVSVVSAPDGLSKLKTSFPEVTVIVAQEDESLNDDKFIVPGLGDFGDRFFGTDRYD